MLKINRKVEYALIALKFMAQKPTGEMTSAREICDKFSTPFDTTAKVMQLMNNRNILNSHKGIKGGYTLAADLSQVSYLELACLIEGKELNGHCYSSKGTLCELYSTCNIISPVESLNSKLNAFLSQLTLKDLLLNTQLPTPSPLQPQEGCPLGEELKS